MTMKKVSKSSLEKFHWPSIDCSRKKRQVFVSFIVSKRTYEGLMRGTHRWDDNVREFAQAEQLDPKTGRAGPVHGFGVETEVLCNRIVVKVMDQLGDHPAKANGRKDRQAKIPKRHGGTPIPCRAAGEVFLAGEDEHSIQNNGDNGNPWMCHHPIAKDDRVVVHFPTA